MAAIAFRSGASTKGPFLTERAMLFRLPLHNELVGALVVARFVTQRRLPPRRHRVVALDATFTTTVRMIDRIHDDAANRWPHAHVANASGFSQRDILVIQIAHLTDRRHAVHVDEPNLSRRKLHVSVPAFFRDQLR